MLLVPCIKRSCFCNALPTWRERKVLSPLWDQQRCCRRCHWNMYAEQQIGCCDHGKKSVAPAVWGALVLSWLLLRLVFLVANGIASGWPRRSSAPTHWTNPVAEGLVHWNGYNRIRRPNSWIFYRAEQVNKTHKGNQPMISLTACFFFWLPRWSVG